MKPGLTRAAIGALLSVAATQVNAGESIIARVFESQDEAVASVLRESGDAPAVWSHSGSRGAAVRTGRSAGAGRDCQEVSTAQIEFTPDLLFTERIRSYCAQSGGNWEKVDDDVRGDASKRFRARYFIPPKLQPQTTWRVDYDPKLFPNATSAYAHALRSGESGTTYWKNGNPGEEGSAGSIGMAASPDPQCRTLVIVREDKGKRADNALSFCPGGSSGWLARTMARDDQAVERVAARLRPLYQERRAEFMARTDTAEPPASEPAPARTAAKTGAPATKTTAGEAPRPSAASRPSSGGSQKTAEQQRTDANQPLAQVPAIKVSEACSASVKGAPWGGGTNSPGGQVKVEEFRAAANHALRSLKLIYGTLTAEQESGVDRLWAPFFDHPTQAALEWFQKANPLLDDYLATLADIDATFPDWRDAMADTLVATASASQSFFQVSAPVAAALGGRLNAARTRLADINSRIEALGDAPNPLAAKCDARSRHKRAVGGGDVWALLKQAKFLGVVDGRPKGKDDDSGAGDVAVTVTFSGRDDEPSYASKVAEDTPAGGFKWTGTRFAYSSQHKNFFSPCSQNLGGGHSTKWSTTLDGEISPDGRKILNLRGQSTSRMCKNDKTGDVEIKTVNIDVPEAVAVLVPVKATAAGPQRVELVYTSPGLVLPERLTEWDPKPGQSFVRFADFLYEEKPINFCRVWVALGCETGGLMGMSSSNAEERARCQMESDRKRKECDAKMAAWTAGKTYVSAKPATAQPAKEPTPTPAAKPAAKPAPPPPADEDAVALKEAVDQHQALAKQYEQNASRWAADAGKEKDPVRRQELEKRAAEIYANASAERDIAASLTTGELVKTRTAWDDTQAKNMRENIKAELDQFSADKKRLDNIHKWLLQADGRLSEGVGEKVSAALKSPNRAQELAKLEGEVYGKVRAEKEQNLVWREKEKELADWELNRPATVAMGAANMAVTITAMAVPGAGPVAMAWGLGTGYAEGGVTGVAKAGARMYSHWIDIAVAGYEGAESGGAWGAAKGAGTAALMNLFMSQVGPRLQKAVTHFEPSVPRGDPKLPKVEARKAAAPDAGIQTAEQNYELAKSKAKSPEELALVKKQYETIEKRQAMKQEIADAVKKADGAAAEAWKDGKLDPSKKAVYDKAVKQLNAEVKAIHEKYAGQENRDLLHGEAIEAAGLTENDIKLSGGKPKSAASDMDVTASSYKAGKDYVSAMAKKSGVKVVEYGDRWVLSNDVTVWKPTAGAKAGSSAFEAEVTFSASKGSDKFATSSGQKYTKGEATGDLQGAVIDNMKKAGEAGLGSQGPKDMHVIGKSADKALEISGADASPALRKKLADLRGHMPPELAGVTQLGAPPAVKAKQHQAFLNETQTALAKSFEKATKSSWEYEKGLIAQQNAARQAGDMPKVAKIQQELATNRSANRTALATVADVAPELIATVLPADAPKVQGKATTYSAPPPLSQLLKRDRDSDGKSAVPLKGDDPALGDLGERCKEAAKKVDAKLKTAKPGSDEANYLGELKRGLENGGRNPAEGIQQVRALSGYELAVVLKQLGVEPKHK